MPHVFPARRGAPPTLSIRISGFVIDSSFLQFGFRHSPSPGIGRLVPEKAAGSPCFASQACYTGVEADRRVVARDLQGRGAYRGEELMAVLGGGLDETPPKGSVRVPLRIRTTRTRLDDDNVHCAAAP